MKSPCTRCKPRSARLGLSRIDCSTYAQENHSRRNGANYCFSQAKCGVMNHKLISTANRRAKVNNGGKNFYRSTFHWISENKNFYFLLKKFKAKFKRRMSNTEIKSILSALDLSFFSGFYRDDPRDVQERLVILIIVRGWPR